MSKFGKSQPGAHPPTARLGRRWAAPVAVLGMALAATTLPFSPASASASPAGPTSGNFGDLSTHDLWKLVHEGGNRAVVGLKAPGTVHGFDKGQVLINPGQRVALQSAVDHAIGVHVVSGDNVLPTVTVTVDGESAVAALRHSPFVDFVEPAAFHGQVADLGCTGNDGNATPAGGDVSHESLTPVPGGDSIPYNFQFSRIQEAWGRSPGGAGVTVGVVDTGIFETQKELRPYSLGGRFDTGLSSNRTVKYWQTGGTDTTQWDWCNHGTRSASSVAGPRDGVGLAGVAYKANLNAVKVGTDVFVDPLESDAVVQGIRWAVDNGARIISMAIGSPFQYTDLAQEIQYEYYSRGVLILAAAGTTECVQGVIYPAKMPEVVAVTGTDSYGHSNIDGCTGPEVDIAAVLSGASAMGRTENDIITWGGSSSATAIASGTAALIWSKYPSMSRDQVRDRLIWAGQGALESGLGNGIVDAYKAVGGMYGLTLSAPQRVAPNTTYYLSAVPQGDGPFTYTWQGAVNSNAQTISAVSGKAGTSQTFNLWVYDSVDGHGEYRTVTVVSQRGAGGGGGGCTTC